MVDMMQLNLGDVQLKRPQAKTRFAQAIADMYAEVAVKEETRFPLKSSL